MMTIYILPCLGADKGQLIRSNSNNVTIYIVELFRTLGEMTFLERSSVRKSRKGPGFGPWEV